MVRRRMAVSLFYSVITAFTIAYLSSYDTLFFEFDWGGAVTYALTFLAVAVLTYFVLPASQYFTHDGAPSKELLISSIVGLLYVLSLYAFTWSSMPGESGASFNYVIGFHDRWLVLLLPLLFFTNVALDLLLRKAKVSHVVLHSLLYYSILGIIAMVIYFTIGVFYFLASWR